MPDSKSDTCTAAAVLSIIHMVAATATAINSALYVSSATAAGFALMLACKHHICVAYLSRHMDRPEVCCNA